MARVTGYPQVDAPQQTMPIYGRSATSFFVCVKAQKKRQFFPAQAKSSHDLLARIF
jgi:hypothetical protein